MFLSFTFFVLVGTIAISLVEFKVISEETSYYYSTIPFRLPGIIYEDLLGFEVPPFDFENEISLWEILTMLYLIFFNVIMYGIVFYFLIGFVTKFRGKSEESRIETPPEPPIFSGE